MTTDRPNVIVVVLDTARADAFEPWGGGTGTTPVVAELAGRGHAVTTALSPSNWTLPSHASLLGGRDARAFGLGQAPGGTVSGVRGPLRDHAVDLLPSVLRESGYDTRGATANAWLSHQSGFDTGFGHFVSLRHDRSALHSSARLRGKARWLASCARPASDDGAGHARSVLRSWFDDGSLRQPFFWFVNLVECHSPYMPSMPYNSLGLLDRLRAATDAQRHQTFDGFLRLNVTDETVSEASRSRMWQLYLDSIRALDDWIGWLVEELERRCLVDDTLLVITSDHGEHFGERGIWGHGHALDSELLHVPLVVSGPGAEHWPDLCSLTWLPALVAERTGVAPRPAWEDPSPVVVSSYDRFSHPEASELRGLLERLPVTAAGLELMTTSLTSATDGTNSLLVRGGESGDPDGLEYVYDAPDDPLVRQRLRDAVGPTLADLARNPDVNTTRDGGGDDPGDLVEQLRLLGYVD